MDFVEKLLQRLMDALQPSALEPNDPVSIFLGLVLTLLCGRILAWHYLRFSPVLSNKRKFSRMFVFIAATTMLVIAVVKTSLALSLGLVGALSIIRFRTPIKEPEELAYLFLAVALGIGFGAREFSATLIVFSALLIYLGLTSSRKGGPLPPRMLVHVTSQFDPDGGKPPEAILDELLTQIGGTSTQVDLRRVDVQERTFNANLILDLVDADQVGALLGKVRAALPEASVSVVEGSSLD